MAMRMLNVILAVAVVVAVAAHASERDDHDLYEFCRKIDEQMVRDPSTWTTSIDAYETAMKQFNTLGSALSSKRKGLAAAWRAVTHDEPCSPKSLAYVHSIKACQPGTNPSLKHLNEDVRKYAKKCITAELIADEFKQYAGAELENFLTSDLLAAYHAANPNERPIHFHHFLLFDNCCKPKAAAKVLAEAAKRDFPQEVEQFSAAGLPKSVEKFLAKHLYKPCASYVKRVDKIMDKIEAAAFYALDKDLSRLPQEVQDGVFRFKFCQNLDTKREREEFTDLLADQF